MLKELLADPHTNEYARADKAADWMVLAKIYLNAEVYTGTIAIQIVSTTVIKL